nr:DUF938 domain-containing protein [Aliamphritea spongicola]
MADGQIAIVADPQIHFQRQYQEQLCLIIPNCERNQQPIFEQLQGLLTDSRHVLEVGSGSGQHALFLPVGFPGLAGNRRS